MDKLSDIFSGAKERFANPIIFSFICSWLIINWRITVGLLWYDAELISLSGNKSLFEFIQNNIDGWHCFLSPLCWSLGLTFVIPVLRVLIKAFYAWVNKWGEKWRLNITRDGKISTSKYLELRAEYKKQTDELSIIIEEEQKKYLKENGQLKNDNLKYLTELENTKTDLIDARETISNFNNMKMLEGTWECKYQVSGQKEILETYYISREMCYLIKSYNVRQAIFRIVDFKYDKHRESVFFVKQYEKKDENGNIFSLSHKINDLSIESEDKLVGKEDHWYPIEYKRIKRR